MKRKITTAAILLPCLLFIMAVTGGLTGKWKGTIKTRDGHGLPVEYNFKADGDKLTGTTKSMEGVFDIMDGKITGDTFTFSNIGAEGETYHTRGKMYPDSCGIDIDFSDGLKVHLTVVRDTSK